jgi:Ca2+-transporting ATPase
MVFTTLAFSRMGLAETMRSERDSLFSMGLLSNKPLLGAVLLTFVLQLTVVYVPFFEGIFQTTALSLSDLGICLGLSAVVSLGLELEKLLLRRKQRDRELRQSLIVQ